MLVLGVAGCATVGAGRLLTPEDLLDRGLEALARGDYASASQDLAWAHAYCPGVDTGERALLAMLALELDPRNPARRTGAAASRAAARIERGDPGWALPVTEALYLLALELGDADVAQGIPGGPHPGPPAMDAVAVHASCPPARGAPAGAPAPLPELPVPTVAARVARVERERDELGGRIGTLEAELAEAQRLLQLREAELAVLEQELARIRRTLRP
jgi:hypothetical protein